MNPALEGYASAVLEGIGEDERRRTAEDLARIHELFLHNEDLRATLTDTALAPGARRAVLEDLLSGKVSGSARRVAGYAAGVVNAPEVPAAMTWLTLRAERAAAGTGPSEGGEPGLSHTEARRRVSGYASGLFEELPTDRLEGMEDEMFRFSRTVEVSPALRSALSDRDIPVEQRQGIVRDLLAGKVQVSTLRLVDYVVRGGRARDFAGTIAWLVEEIARARGWRIARVRAGQEVPDEERNRLTDSLSHLAGSPVELHITVDPSLLAGVKVRIGDLQLDATARDRLDQLRQHLAGGDWGDSGASSRRPVRPGTPAGRD